MNYRKSLVALVAMLTVASTQVASLGAAAATEEPTLQCFPHVSEDLRYDDTWGAARSGGRGHKGTDIMGPKGTEVIAVADGVVETMKSGGSSGYYVRLVHAGGWESWYMHLNNDTPGTDDGRGGEETAYAEGLAEGHFVEAGEVIGYVGDSGNAEGSSSHTHFELHINDQAVNPYPFLIEAETRKEDAKALVVDLAFLADEVEVEDRAEIWGGFSESGAVHCLPDGFKNVVQHVYGQLPREGVLLTGVVAR